MLWVMSEVVDAVLGLSVKGNENPFIILKTTNLTLTTTWLSDGGC